MKTKYIFILISFVYSVSPSLGQSFDTIEFGLSGGSNHFLSSFHRTVFYPSNYWSLKGKSRFIGPIWVTGELQWHSFTARDKDYYNHHTKSYIVLFSYQNKLYKNVSISMGLGFGITKFETPESLKNPEESESILASEVELSAVFKKFVLFSDIKVVRVMSFNRDDRLGLSIGLRYKWNTNWLEGVLF
ncbi:hypothetical protein EP331_10245 [bacterium]|nr:MAG: hypothetical protein EP331_10245 [bacterium]